MVHVVDKNRKAVLVDKGNGTTASAKNATHLQGDVVVKLYNDNLREGIDVTVKAVAVIVTKVYEDRTILTNQYVAKNKNAVKKAVVKETQVPLMR
jgi:hypothetical protein